MIFNEFSDDLLSFSSILTDFKTLALFEKQLF